MIPFDFQLRTRIVFGPGTLDTLGDLARQLGGKRVLVVSDPGIIAAGHTQRGIERLNSAGCATHLFSDICENPTTQCVEAGVAVARQFDPDLLVGMGGGSSLDSAKGINFVFTNGGRMQDYWGTGKATQPMLPMIGIPTTSGTGSETQSYALISDAETHVKMACGDKKAACAIALLDPALTLTQPPTVTALTGIDAIAHAVESYVTKSRNSISLAFSREAWRLLSGNFARVLEAPEDLEARGAMQLGACLAGLAIENSMLGAAHALANPLTAHYEIPHGQAVALMLPHVVRFNGEQVNGWYRDLLTATSGEDGRPVNDTGADGMAQFLTTLIEQSGLSSRLSQLAVTQSSLSELADDATRQWTAGHNPRQVGKEDLLELYRKAW